MLLASQRQSSDGGKRGVLFARNVSAGIPKLAHPAEARRVAGGGVRLTVLDSCGAVQEDGALVAVWFAALLPVGVDVTVHLVRCAPDPCREEYGKRAKGIIKVNSAAKAEFQLRGVPSTSFSIGTRNRIYMTAPFLPSSKEVEIFRGVAAHLSGLFPGEENVGVVLHPGKLHGLRKGSTSPVFEYAQQRGVLRSVE